MGGWHEIELSRDALLMDDSPLKRLDLGAGSRRRAVQGERAVPVMAIAKSTLTRRQDVQALVRWLVAVAPSGRFLELGTSLGITSAYVCRANWEVETWEGCPETLSRAQRVWNSLGLAQQIHARCGDFRDLAQDIPDDARWDVVYLDGLHEEKATLHLVAALTPHVNTCIVVDDIAWSFGMHRAWRALKQAPEWDCVFSWRGKGFLVKAPGMAFQEWRLA